MIYRLFISVLVILVFVSSFAYVRSLAYKRDDITNQTLKNLYVSEGSLKNLVDIHNDLRVKYIMEQQDVERLKDVVRSYVYGYYGMYMHLKKEGKTDREINDIIIGYSKGLDLNLEGK